MVPTDSQASPQDLRCSSQISVFSKTLHDSDSGVSIPHVEKQWWASLVALREASVKDSRFLSSYQAVALLWLISKP